MKFVTAVFIGAALIVGVAIGYMYDPSSEVGGPAAARVQDGGAVRDEGESASLRALRAKVAELEARLAERGSEKPAGDAPAAVGDERHGWGSGARSPKEWREKMIREDPSRYAQITNRLARMRQDRLSVARQKIDFFASIDAAKLPEPARKVHEELQELIMRREELEQKMHEAGASEEGLSRETMHEFIAEMRQTDERIRELNANERDNLISETVKNLGFGADDAEEIAGVLREIVENTDSFVPFGGGPGRTRPRR